ncbi:MAG: hypothetical protein ABWZ99_14600 [Ilumatobacteraceae bacterium]
MGSERQAFELVFLDAPGDVDELAGATAALHALNTADFTDVAAATLEARGIAPGSQSISGRRSTWFSRANTTKYPGWRFEVYLPGQWANARIQLWLLTDRRWGLATEPQVGTLMSTSSFQLVELTSERQHYLIDARAGRVANWLEHPKGKLNPAIE